MASCDSEVHRASGSGRGKPFLACSLGFHAINLERSIILLRKSLFSKSSQCRNESLFYCLVARGGHTADGRNDKPTLAAHARRGLTSRRRMRGIFGGRERAHNDCICTS